MKTLGSRIARYRKDSGLTQGQLAKLCGWASQSRVGNYENDSREPTLGDLNKIADALNIRLMQLIAMDEKESNVIAADFSSKGKLKDGELSIPQYNVRGALGHGQIPADYIETIRHVTVHESMLSGRGISFSKADNLAIITGFGQSMEGTINDGDPLIVDRGINQFIGDGIYVLTWDNLLYVKRLQKHCPTQFDMISDNPLHKDQVINIADVTIHARVLMVWNAKKL